jgi:predicted MFS family arabinose efflux permease
VVKTKTANNHGSSAFLITTACLLLLLSFGYRSGFGLFVKPITEANGWGREVISIALAIQNLFWGHQLGSFSGVWLGGWLYDHSSSYDIVWWLGAALGIMAAVVHWPIRERPVRRRVTEKS